VIFEGNNQAWTIFTNNTVRSIPNPPEEYTLYQATITIIPSSYNYSFEYLASDNVVSTELIARPFHGNGPCPLGTIDVRGSIEPEPENENGRLQIEGNRIFWEQTSNPSLAGATVYNYFQHVPTRGGCTYRINFEDNGGIRIEFSDQTGVLYSERRAEQTFTYSVECDNCCEPNELLCKSDSYPGYACVPCEPIADRFDNMRGQL
jgi:hypothetical protein